MGGLIAIMLAETYPGQYVGAIPLCAAAGGSKATLDYGGHTIVLFDFFYPGVLPGDLRNVPEDLDVEADVVAPALAAIVANPVGAQAIAVRNQTPVRYASAAELLQSIATTLAGVALLPDSLRRTHGHWGFDNTETVYSGPLPAPLLQQINLTSSASRPRPALSSTWSITTRRPVTCGSRC